MVLFAVITQLATGADSIIVKKDPRLDILSVKQMQANRRSSMLTPGGLYKGFRIQVISTNKRDEATFTQADLQLKYPEEKIYLSYQSPNFKVRLGNYLKRSDAEKVRQQLNTLLSRSAYIVEDAIEYTPKEGDSIFL